MKFKSKKQQAAVMAKLRASGLSPRLQQAIMEDPKLMDSTFKQIQNKRVFLKYQDDADKDGVKNVKDCRPLDPKKQGLIHDVRMKVLKWQEEKLEKQREDRQKTLNDKLDELKERRAIAEKKVKISQAELAQKEAVADQLREERQKKEEIERKIAEADAEIEKTSLKGKLKRFAKSVGSAGKATAKEIKRFSQDPKTKKAIKKLFEDEKPKRNKKRTIKRKVKRKKPKKDGGIFDL